MFEFEYCESSEGEGTRRVESLFQRDDDGESKSQFTQGRLEKKFWLRLRV